MSPRQRNRRRARRSTRAVQRPTVAASRQEDWIRPEPLTMSSMTAAPLSTAIKAALPSDGATMRISTGEGWLILRTVL